MMVDLQKRPEARDVVYYTQRAAAARRSAARADDPHIRAIHLGMASRYEAMAAPDPVARRIGAAADHLTDALQILDEEGRMVQAAHVATALEMLGADPAA